MELFAHFICKWTQPDHRPERVGAREFEAVEARLGLLPRSYKEAVLRHGLPHPAMSLREAINAGDLDLGDISEFLTPNEIVNTTEGWRDFGLPMHLVAFASDCLGNLFCFESGRPDQDAVWLFDHDFDDFSRVAPSFRDWIASYCEIALPADAVRA
jgi:hypothetical protein